MNEIPQSEFSHPLSPELEAIGAHRGPTTTGQRIKFVSFSLLVALLLLLALEVLVRVTGNDRPDLRSPLVNVGWESVHQSDDETFFSIRPNIDVAWQGFRVVTNSHGLRCPEFGEKNGEFRILSLGESSTFGDRVENDETYSMQLEHKLTEHNPGQKYRVINAGVCAYSSFQSVKYLEARGLALEPDMVLFYHEFADFLPTANRESLAANPLGMGLTDKQLYLSKRQRWNRRLLAGSALYRYAKFQLARLRLQTPEPRDAQTPEPRDGNEAPGGVPIPWQLRQISTPEGLRMLKLPQRVPLEDRRENFEKLLQLCRTRNIQLVIIHPSYRLSKPHECDLTAFCREHNIPMFDAQASLHPDENDPARFFADLWHPNAQGQGALARDLDAFLERERLVPLDSPPRQAAQ